MRFIIVLFCFLYPVFGSTQIFNQSIIKTRLIQGLIAYNPSISYEKSIYARISVEAEVSYLNRRWKSTGGEWDFGHFFYSTGVKFSIGSKYYFFKKNRLIKPTQEFSLGSPFGLYFSAQFKYKNVQVNGLKKYDFHSTYLRTINTKQSIPGISILWGKQVPLFNILSIETFGGITFQFNGNKTEEIRYSINLSEIGQTNNIKIEPLAFELGLRIGYYFKSKNKCIKLP